MTRTVRQSAHGPYWIGTLEGFAVTAPSAHECHESLDRYEERMKAEKRNAKSDGSGLTLRPMPWRPSDQAVFGGEA